MSEPTSPAQAECPGPPALPERRASVRYPYRNRPMIRFLVRPSFQSARAFVKNISATGIGLLLSQEVPPGAVLFLQLRGTRRGATRTHLARVVHVTPEGPGRWLVGCRMVGTLSEEELHEALREDR